MAYDLIIFRPAEPPEYSNPISTDDWIAAVKSVEGIRFRECPPEEEELPYEVEVFIPKTGKWKYLIHWRRSSGTAVLNASSLKWRGNILVSIIRAVVSKERQIGTVDVRDPLWKAASQLALRLNASIGGDDGELYDLKTGEAKFIE